MAAIDAEIAADLGGAAPPPANVQRLRPSETPQQRFRRALALRARIEAGGAVETPEAVWLGGYEAGPEWRSFRDLYDDFGEAAL